MKRTPCSAALSSAIVMTRAGVPGQGDRVGEQAGPGGVEHGVHPAGGGRSDPLGPAVAVADGGRAERGKPAEVALGRRSR